MNKPQEIYLFHKKLKKYHRFWVLWDENENIEALCRGDKNEPDSLKEVSRHYDLKTPKRLLLFSTRKPPAWMLKNEKKEQRK